MNDHDDAREADASDRDSGTWDFLGPSPEIYESARWVLRDGDDFIAMRRELEKQKLTQEHVDQVVRDVAAEFIEPLVLGQVGRQTVLERLIERRMSQELAQSVIDQVENRHEQRLQTRGLKQSRETRWLDMILALLGVGRIHP